MKKIFVLVLALVIMLCCAGCGEQKLYDEANALLEAENYEEALAKFQELGDYEDSAAKCKEAEKNIKYKEGLEFLNTEDYESAEKIFSSLENFKDSTEKLKETQIEIKYNQALKLLDEKHYGGAYTVLTEIKDSKDVNTYLNRFKTIEITPENWRTYFEVKEIPIFIDNTFGEAEEIQQCQCVVLNDEYNSLYCFGLNCKVDFEFSFEWNFGKMKVDAVAHTYEKATCSSYINEKGTTQFNDNALSPQNTYTTTYENYGSIKQENVFFCPVAQPDYSNIDSGMWVGGDIKNVELTRVKGSIIVYK